MVHGGVCLARLKDGRLGLIRGGIPGELVRADLASRSGVQQGAVTEVLEASPDRVEATAHPGLDLDHISYPRQLQLKREVVIDALERALPREAELPEVAAVVPSPLEWGYRNIVQPSAVRGRFGYRLPGTHEVRLLDSDPVASEPIRAAWDSMLEQGLAKGVREVVIRSNDAGEVLVALVASASARNYLEYAHELVRAGISGVAWAGFDPRGRFRRGAERLAGTRLLNQQYGDFSLSVSVSSFAQPNPAAAGELFRELAALAGSGSVAHDLYAGGGAISFHLASQFSQVHAFEIDRASVRRGVSDAKKLGISNVEFHAGDVRDVQFGREAELITVDPPRAGLSREVREAISASAARRLIYVSCDAATWARDVADLSSRGWQIAQVKPWDFYPQTHHVELLSLLLR